QPHLSGPDDAGRAFARDRKENGPRDVELILPVGIDEKRHGTMRHGFLPHLRITIAVQYDRPTLGSYQIGSEVRRCHDLLADTTDPGAKLTTEIRLPRRCGIEAQTR